MIHSATIEDAIAQFTRTVSFRRAEKDLDFVAVCLIGHLEPVPVRVGSNATKCPVSVRISRDPDNAAKRADLEHPVHPLAVLEYVWTRTDAHARRLKASLDARIIGQDAGMTTLRHSWRDLPEWRVAWPILLADAIQDLHHGGETVEVFSEEMRVHKTVKHARARIRG